MDRTDIDFALSVSVFSHVQWEETADGLVVFSTPFGRMEWDRDENVLFYGGKKVEISSMQDSEDDEVVFFESLIYAAIAAYRNKTAYTVFSKRGIHECPMETAFGKGTILSHVEPRMVYLIPKYYDILPYIRSVDVEGKVQISDVDGKTVIRIPQGEIRYDEKRYLIESPGISVNTYKIHLVSPMCSYVTFFAALVNAAFLSANQGIPWYIVRNEEDGLLHPSRWFFSFHPTADTPFVVVYPRRQV